MLLIRPKKKTRTALAPRGDESTVGEEPRRDATADDRGAAQEGPEADRDEAVELEADDAGDREGETPAPVVPSRVRHTEASVPSREVNLFRRYLRDVNDVRVMAPEQEFEIARRIEALKIDLWRAVLGFRTGGAEIVAAIEERMPERFSGWERYRGLVVGTDRRGASAFERALERFAEAASAADPEGLFQEDVIERLVHRPPPAVRRIKGWAAYQKTVSARRAVLRDAKNRFVAANLRLVIAVAGRYSRELLSFEDLVQEGNIGLMKAVDRYDYRRGFRFSTYASWWIRHAIGRALADKARLVRLPVHVLDSQQKVERARRVLLAQLGRRPSAEEIASTVGLPIEEVEKVNALPSTTPVSLDEPFSDDEDRSRLESLADPEPGPAPLDRMETIEKESAMLRIMTTLKPVEIDILRKRFGLLDGRERTLQEIGDEHSLSRERIRQVQDRALSKLRVALSRDAAVAGPAADG